MGLACGFTYDTLVLTIHVNLSITDFSYEPRTRDHSHSYTFQDCGRIDVKICLFDVLV